MNLVPLIKGIGPILLAVFITRVSAAESPLELRLIVPEGTADAVKKTVLAPKQADDQVLFCAAEVLMNETAVSGASAFREPSLGWAVMVALTEPGQKRFTEITSAQVHHRLGILSSGRLLCAPQVNEPLKDETFMISGLLSEEEAHTLAGALTSQPAQGGPSAPQLPLNPHRDPAATTPMEMKADGLASMLARQFATAQATYHGARKRFLAGLPHGQVLGISATLSDKTAKEKMGEVVTLYVQEIQGDKITGTLAAAPTIFTNYEKGDRLTISPGDILAWQIADASKAGKP